MYTLHDSKFKSGDFMKTLQNMYYIGKIKVSSSSHGNITDFQSRLKWYDFKRMVKHSFQNSTMNANM